RKTQPARAELTRRFEERSGGIIDLGSLRGAERIYPDPNRENFPLFYPYLPWTVSVIPDVVKGIAQAANRDEALTGSNRTMIGVERSFQDKVRARQEELKDRSYDLSPALKEYESESAFRFEQVPLAGREIPVRIELDSHLRAHRRAGDCLCLQPLPARPGPPDRRRRGHAPALRRAARCHLSAHGGGAGAAGGTGPGRGHQSRGRRGSGVGPGQ
ncbi:MAG: hypothetical protein HY328_06565, partial [Chloroflexi bacterium]|nr:hypothetical protein [Chloroflexota bacterium]